MQSGTTQFEREGYINIDLSLSAGAWRRSGFQAALMHDPTRKSGERFGIDHVQMNMLTAADKDLYLQWLFSSKFKFALLPWKIFRCATMASLRWPSAKDMG